MEKVWVVTRFNGNDFLGYAVFSNKEAAEKAAEGFENRDGRSMYDTATVEEVTVKG